MAECATLSGWGSQLRCERCGYPLHTVPPELHAAIFRTHRNQIRYLDQPQQRSLAGTTLRLDQAERFELGDVSAQMAISEIYRCEVLSY